jgi:hypothetical protein
MYDFIYKNLPSVPKKFHSKTSPLLKCTRLQKNKTFYYFAADSDLFLDSFQAHAKAYGKAKNCGIAKTDSLGCAKVYLKCPQVYKNTDGNVYPRHFHVFYWDEKKKAWDPSVHTYNYKCSVPKSMTSNKRFVVVSGKFDKENWKKCKPTTAILLCGSESENEKRAQVLQKLGFMNLFFHTMKSKSKMVGVTRPKETTSEIQKLIDYSNI